MKASVRMLPRFSYRPAATWPRTLTFLVLAALWSVWAAIRLVPLGLWFLAGWALGARFEYRKPLNLPDSGHN